MSVTAYNFISNVKSLIVYFSMTFCQVGMHRVMVVKMLTTLEVVNVKHSMLQVVYFENNKSSCRGKP